jgi:deoxyinosine 3'endonuclease (endonuclease V)
MDSKQFMAAHRPLIFPVPVGFQEQRIQWNNHCFTGVRFYKSTSIYSVKDSVINGIRYGLVESINGSEKLLYCVCSGRRHGYALDIDMKNNYIRNFSVYDMATQIYTDNSNYKDNLSLGRDKDHLSELLQQSKITEKIAQVMKDYDCAEWDVDAILLRGQNKKNIQDIYRALWAYEWHQAEQRNAYAYQNDILPDFYDQWELQSHLLRRDTLPTMVQNIAGLKVSFHELEQRLVAVIVVFDAQSHEVLDQAVAETDLTFCYIPELYSFREVPLLKKAYAQLTVRPDLLFCDGQGLTHPMFMGVATQLGIELNLPSIGCASNRLVGDYDPTQLAAPRGSRIALKWRKQVVGNALRIREGEKPLFISVGHRLRLRTACQWVLRETENSLLPEPLRVVRERMLEILPEPTQVEFLRD